MATDGQDHQIEIHENPLNDGTAWYQVTCSCGWVHEDPTVENSARRIYSQETAKLIRDQHLEEVG